MPAIKRWSGNDTTLISIDTKGYAEIVSFAKEYRDVYVFGNGHIGKAMQKYLFDSGIILKGIVTSDNISEYREKIDSQACLIVAVGDCIIEEIMQCILSVFCNKQVYIPSADVRESIGNILDVDRWKEDFWLNVYVTNKCNLGCKSCSAFAPICKADYYELAAYIKDIERVAEMRLQRINQIKFTGAEAMLHPDILEMIEYTRTIFPKIEIEVYTNGLFLNNYSKEKLKKLDQLNVRLVVTEYPLPNLDLQEAYAKLDECKVKYNVIYADEQKYFSKRPLRFEGDVAPERYIECPRYKMCNSLFLFRGKLFKCIYAISAEYVNEAFGKSLEVKNDDYVDIYKSKSDDVYNYAISRIPFCRYCSPIEEKVLWGLSEKKLEEWS